jgi:nucleotide-binding universal stress UspA family protein
MRHAERDVYYAAEGARNRRASGARPAKAERWRDPGPHAEAQVCGERRLRDLPMTVLVPVDGSPASENAVRHVIGLRASGMALKVHLLNVQAPETPSEIGYETREGAAYRALAADNATRAARALLVAAGVDYESHVRIGGAAEAIVRFAREKRCHKIVIGTRRLGTFAGLVLGSVARRVLARAALPVTLVRER